MLHQALKSNVNYITSISYIYIYIYFSWKLPIFRFIPSDSMNLSKMLSHICILEYSKAAKL